MNQTENAAIARFEYFRGTGASQTRAYWELLDGEELFWEKEPSEARWYPFKPTDRERSEIRLLRSIICPPIPLIRVEEETRQLC